MIGPEWEKQQGQSYQHDWPCIHSVVTPVPLASGDYLPGGVEPPPAPPAPPAPGVVVVLVVALVSPLPQPTRPVLTKTATRSNAISFFTV